MAEVLGLKELERRLKALGTEVAGKNLLGKALRKGANIIRDQAKINAPYDPKPNEPKDKDGNRGEITHIRDQIKVRRDPNPQLQGKNEIMYVKPFYTKKKNVAYWWFNEFGSAKTKATRFMTKAFESKKLSALEAFKIDLAKQIKREAKKLSK